MDKVIVTALGVMSIVGIYWFFFGKKSDQGDRKISENPARTAWDIVVDGGYQPGVITIPNGQKSTLTFLRKDTNSCLEEIIISEFRVKTFLPIHTPVTIALSPTKTGTFEMHCGMNMFHGKIVVI